MGSNFDFSSNNAEMNRSSDLKPNSDSSSNKDEMNRVHLGSCSIPLVPGGVIGFTEPLRALTRKVLDDDFDDDNDNGYASVVVVSAAGGSGKTTLVTMLCHDQRIKDKFGKNIFFVTVSKAPNFKVIVNNLCRHIYGGQQFEFQHDVEAKNLLGNLFNEVTPMLLVLDDVCSDSFIDNFMFKLKSYKVVVTSRYVFSRFHTYVLEPLSDEDAKSLFSRSAKGGKEWNDIPKKLVNEMVKCCKNYPLALSVVGSSLNGKHVAFWDSTREALSEGRSVLDLNKDILPCLEKSLDALDQNSTVKQCYLDLGSFPEEYRIEATTLSDMWVEMYQHKEDGMDTLTTLYELSFRNLVNLKPLRRYSKPIVSYCEEQIITQHKMLRELAIHLSNQNPPPLRKRLIIDACGRCLPKWIQQVKQPLNAHLLSISTDETFSSIWPKIKVPEVKVLVLNFKSKDYTLPQFLGKMKKLKVLIVANYGPHSTSLSSFPQHSHSSYSTKLTSIHSLSSLTRIRLVNVSIPSFSKSILEMTKLQKLSLKLCNLIGAFEVCTSRFPSLVEIEMDYCSELEEFPAGLCNVINLRKLSITNCNDLRKLPEGFGGLINLEVLRINCTNLALLPESLGNMHKLRALDISDCWSLVKLPRNIGQLSGLRTIHVKGCSSLFDLPPSLKDLRCLDVVCTAAESNRWTDFDNVTISIVEEDKFAAAFDKIYVP